MTNFSGIPRPPGASRVDILQSLLERVRRNAREPRAAAIAIPAIANVSASAPIVERPQVDDIELSPESVAFDLVPSPKSPATAPYDGRNFEIARAKAVPPPPPSAFLDEPTATGDSQAVENLLVQEQALANIEPEPEPLPRAKIRFDENRAPTTRPPPEPLATRAPDGDNPPDLLVLEEFEEADAAVTEPPPAQPDIPPVAVPAAALPDLDAIEADLLEANGGRSSVAPNAELNGAGAISTFDAAASARPQTTLVDESEPEVEVEAEIEPAEDSSRTRQHHFLEEATGERLKSSPPPDDDAPSSVRKPRESERAEDVRFDGFGPIETPSEPPPESGEVPSQRRIATPHDLERVSEAEAEAAEPTADQARGIEPEFDHEETKEVRALGRVDVVERTRVEQPLDIAVLKGEPRAVETFAAVLDAALSLSLTPPH